LPRGGRYASQLVEDEVEAEARDELHDVVVQAVLLAHPEDRHDVRVVQPRCRPRFPPEAAQLPRVQQRVGRQDLDGHVPAQGELVRLVHHAHAAPAHLAQDPVIQQLAQGRPGGRACPCA
jgi:hypothetical protein